MASTWEPIYSVGCILEQNTIDDTKTYTYYLYIYSAAGVSQKQSLLVNSCLTSVAVIGIPDSQYVI